MKNDNIPEYYALHNSEIGPLTDITVGKKVTLSKIITEDDINSFLKLSGDNNPIHLKEDFASRTMFKERVAYGLLSLMLISSGLTRLMGPGNIWLSQEFSFVNPIRINDEITANLEIIEISKNKTCTILTTCINQQKQTVLEGRAKSRVFPIKNK
jgi:acyl dehydratase